jgi:hypothetical protein
MIGSGVVEKKVWKSGKGACPICNKLNGQERDLDKPFKVSYNGKEYDVMTPPSHPNCRCTFTAKIMKE